ncbi:MAG: thiamine pyrophosphate-dependent enzyme, partial [Chloroflexota bacterium]
GTMFDKLGSGLGWGLGAALGAKLAAPDKTVVTLVGDGSFNFGCPISTLWAAHCNRAPFLCVVFNNGGYMAPKMHHRQAYGPDSYLEKGDVAIGSDFVSPPDYAAIARACHAHAETVDDPSAIRAALKRALKQVRAGQAALLDVKIAKPPRR